MRNLSKPLLSLLLLTSALTACGAADEWGDDPLGTAEEEIKICPGKTTIEGIDVSGYQDNTNWTNVKNAGIKFAFIKSTESTSYVNPNFSGDWAAAKSNGIVRGSYHFFHANVDGVAQAKHFVNTMGQLSDADLPGVLDLETADGQSASTIANRALDFLEYVEEHTGKRPLIYTAYYFWQDNVAHLPELEKYPLWIANYVSPSSSCPLVPDVTWDTFKFWQYTSTGSVSGVNGNVDRNLFNGSLADLYAFASSSGGSPLPSQLTGNEAISVLNWQDKHAEVFVTARDGNLFHTYSQADATTWAPLDAIDAGAQCGFAAGMWPAPKNLPEVFSPKDGGSTQNLGFDGSAWGAFADFGGMGLSKLSTLTWPDGHMEVFARGEDKAVWHNFWNLTSQSWSGWQSLGGSTATAVGPIVWGDGHAELLITADDGTPYLNFSGNFEGGWYGWLKLEGSLSSRPVPVRWADGHIELFARGTDGYLHHALFDGSKWGPFQPVSTTIAIEGEPSVIMNSDKNGAIAGPEVFARDASGAVVHLWWDGSKYTDFVPLGNQESASDPFGWMRADGRAEVFAIDAKGDLVRTYRTDADWAAWDSLGGGNLDACVPGSGPSDGAGGGGVGGSSGDTSSSAGTGTGSSSGSGGTNVNGGGDEGGCACSAAGAPAQTPSAIWLAAAVLPLILRRRRDR